MDTSNQSSGKQSWSASEVIGEGSNWMERYLGWWYRLTVPPRAPANASLMRREIDRKARLLSTVVFCYEQLKQAISWYTQVLYQATLSSQLHLPIRHTGTELDPLMHTFKKLQESWYNVREPMGKSRDLQ